MRQVLNRKSKGHDAISLGPSVPQNDNAVGVAAP
jgi:hypothetical protein